MIETDYLVIGAGAMGMAFTDVLLTESDATVTIVDRRGQPGGHWNDAYPFVRLHQPSMFYGVCSTPLGSDQKDSIGLNAGLFELASKGEILAYFDHVLRRRFMPSDRVRYLPMHELQGDDARSLLTGELHKVRAHKTVDATYMNVTVPKMRAPAYEVAPGMTVVPPNDLPEIPRPADRYVVIGAGKTGIDSCLWLLEQQVHPDRITWIMPRDSWLLDREQTQPTALFFEETMGGYARELEEIAKADSIRDLFSRLEKAGRLLRLDSRVTPTMYRCATVTRQELAELRRIEDVVRLGRVERVGASEIELDQGNIETSRATVHVDCTADGLERRPERPIFDGNRLILQSVRTCQQVFSAALIAFVETRQDSDPIKNELCQVIPHPDSDLDWLRCTLQNTLNSAHWSDDEQLSQWLSTCRLDVASSTLIGVDPSRVAPTLERARAAVGPALDKLRELLAEHQP